MAKMRRFGVRDNEIGQNGLGPPERSRKTPTSSRCLNVMVANARIGSMSKAVEMSLADWRRQTAVKLDRVFLWVKYAVLAMRRAGRGSIIIMSPVAGLRGSAGLASYCDTKSGRVAVR